MPLSLSGRAPVRLSKVLFDSGLALLAASIVLVVLINWLLFPECSRATNDCFLINALWR